MSPIPLGAVGREGRSREIDCFFGSGALSQAGWNVPQRHGGAGSAALTKGRAANSMIHRYTASSLHHL
ncbi:MAG: hypothetical protein QGH20_02905, partial [Candidatus Latescibacteria bacterium]|nr:hypothetical protein [Candidatus Latescibacterota bacterium]